MKLHRKKLRKFFRTIVLVAILLLGLSSCSKKPTWQDQYDLGMKYLEEGNYEEAIAAFSAAIEIDAVPVEAHKELSNALYLSVGETDEQELNDEQRALCEQTRDAYLWLIESGNAGADEYIKAAEMDEKLGDLDAALEIINRGIENVEDEKLTQKRRWLELEFMSSKSYSAVIFKNDDSSFEEYDTWRSYGIRFFDPVGGLIDGRLIEVETTNVVWSEELDKKLDEELDGNIDLLAGKTLIVRGWLGLVEDDDNCYAYAPNGAYDFCIESYEIAE